MQSPSIFGRPVGNKAPQPSTPTLGGTNEEFCAHGPDEIILDQLRDALRPLTTTSARKCGYLPRRRTTQSSGPDTVSIVVERDAKGDSHASFREAVYCKSAYACPPCMYRRRVAAAAELKRVVAAWRAAGGEVFMLSLTMGHQRGHKLRQLRQLQRGAWRTFAHSRTYKREMTQLGVVHVLHTMEVTYGVTNGWHPHIHALLLIQPDLSRMVEEASLSALQRQWKAAVQKALAASKVPQRTWWQYVPGILRGATLTKMNGSGDYIVKFGLDVSAGASDPVEEGRTAWAVMLGAATGNDADRALWKEYADAMRGQHLVHGLGDVIKALGLEARPAKFPTRRKTVVAVMPERIYRSLERVCGAIPRVLHGAEKAGLRGVAISVAADVFGVFARDPTRLPTEVHRLIRMFNPAGPCAHPSTWLPGGGTGGASLRHLRRSRAIAVSRVRRRRVACANVLAAAA